MKLAYLILTHNQPRQAACLAKTLANCGGHVFMHVDAKSDLTAWQRCLGSNEHITLLQERVSCCWGHFSLVKASLELLRHAASIDNWDYFILLSGQDYPVKSLAQIETFFKQHQGQDFMEYFPLPSEKLREKQGGLYRINRFHQIRENYHSEFPPYSKKPLLNTLFNKWAALYASTKRKMPLDMQPYAGSQWWMLTGNTVGVLLQFLEQHPSVEAFFRNVWIPDEIFFQTVLLHLQKQHGFNITNNPYRYTEWSDHAGEKTFNPKVLCEADFEKLLRSEALFARKFDENASARLVQLIKTHYGAC